MTTKTKYRRYEYRRVGYRRNFAAPKTREIPDASLINITPIFAVLLIGARGGPSTFPR